MCKISHFVSPMTRRLWLVPGAGAWAIAADGAFRGMGDRTRLNSGRRGRVSISMNCCQVRDALVDYLTAQLGGGQREQIERHTRGCVDCARLMAMSRQTLGLRRFSAAHIEDPQPEDVPDALLRDIVAHGTRWR